MLKIGVGNVRTETGGNLGRIISLVKVRVGEDHTLWAFFIYYLIKYDSICFVLRSKKADEHCSYIIH